MVERERCDAREGALERLVGLDGTSCGGMVIVPVRGDMADLGRGTAAAELTGCWFGLLV
jgi:hypothetical protein